jgi:DNA polymerase III subunit delta'
VTASALLERLAGRPESFPGSLLLTSTSEKRLKTEARRLAAILLRSGEETEELHDSSRRALAGIHPDLSVVEPQGVQIRIDSIREAIAFGAGKPYEAPRRVAVVQNAEQLGLEAANALLKSLEEPGKFFHWILTTARPEALLPTVRSRCVTVALARESRAERAAAWVSRGFSEEDAAELAGLQPETEEDAPARLEESRKWRTDLLLALETGISQRRVAPLLLLAEALAHAEPGAARVFSEILADAAVVASGSSSERPRHRAVAGGIHDLARRLTPEALARAALKAADAPADSRRGNKRLHYESLLLELLGVEGSERLRD